MASSRRVTVTLPEGMVEEMDQHERNRSRFMQVAIERELGRRRMAALRASLRSPHEESLSSKDDDLAAWAATLPSEDASAIVGRRAGSPVRWIPGKGWVRGRR